jgi:hypothetical protein
MPPQAAGEASNRPESAARTDHERGGDIERTLAEFEAAQPHAMIATSLDEHEGHSSSRWIRRTHRFLENRLHGTVPQGRRIGNALTAAIGLSIIFAEYTPWVPKARPLARIACVRVSGTRPR